MQRLLSFKTVSEPRRKLSNPYFLNSHLCKDFVSVTERNPKQLVNPSDTQPFWFPHTFVRSYFSWRSQPSASEKVYGFLASPSFVKQVVPIMHLRNRSRSLYEGGVSCLRTHFLRRKYEFNSNPESLSLSRGWILSRSIYEGGFRLLRAQFPRRHFDFNFKPESFSSRRGWRSWFTRFSADEVVWGLILANISIFFLWKIADPVFMREHFMISVENIRSGRVHTLITSAFSHIDLEHLVTNMIGLYFFGMNIGRTFGPEFLLKLYLAGAVGGSVFYLVHHAFMAPKIQGSWYVDHSRVPGLGASGAVNAIMLLDIFMFPKATIYFQLIIPIPAIFLGAILIGKDILRIMEGDSQISGSAHLGGAAVAALTWARIRKRWI